MGSRVPFVKAFCLKVLVRVTRPGYVKRPFGV